MIGKRMLEAIVVVVLLAALGWPALATVHDAIRGESNPSGGLVTPIEGGAAIRPWRLAGETLRLVATTELLALPIGIALAFLLFRTDLPGRTLWRALLALMACVPMPLQASGWLGGFGNLGRSQALGSEPILVGRFGAAFVHAVACLPWIVWIVGIGLLSVEPELEEAAMFDMSTFRIAWSVTLRRSLGSLAGAALAVAVLTAGDMTVTDLLAIRTYAEEAYLQFGIGNGPGAASATALPPLILLGTLIVVGTNRLMNADPARILSNFTSAPIRRLHGWRIPLGFVVALILGLLIGLPLYSLIWRAGRVKGNAALGLAPYWSIGGLAGTLRASLADVLGPAFRRPLRSPLVASLLWGAVGSGAATTFAWVLAWLCRKPGPWRAIAALATALALAVPGPVAGMALVLAYHDVQWIYSTPVILCLAYFVRIGPYALLLLWPALRAIPEEAFESAELDGLGPLGQAWSVALPYTSRAIGLAWAVTFVLALGELPASGLLVPPGLSTLTIFAISGGLVAFGLSRIRSDRGPDVVRYRGSTSP